MGRVAGFLDDPPGFPYTPPGVDVLEGQVTFIYIALLTIQIVSKQLHNIKIGK